MRFRMGDEVDGMRVGTVETIAGVDARVAPLVT
jgi:hypothetical protein